MYDRPNFEGRSLVLSVGDYNCDFTNKEKFDNQMQSFRVPEGIKLTLYDACNSGDTKTFDGPLEGGTGLSWGGKASSFKVEEIVGGCC